MVRLCAEQLAEQAWVLQLCEVTAVPQTPLPVGVHDPVRTRPQLLGDPDGVQFWLLAGAAVPLQRLLATVAPS